ncbi:flagellar biosynthesis anti-sigma factor FlgM [Saccharophagus degradans]|uniref:flagellar biosynthesis anti-sigma factor FlgM n=1 Tax=Saccharophagus degradans TaxID=86304 RepID=UPI001C09457C|nr:flagellar biosynthesis anti-sigma factor FlgM [Saccharophagus degradans]MBU2985877.1 flagellar biosynthesis anti-sigma factor FlgM [Saccharophagus degradans]
MVIDSGNSLNSTGGAGKTHQSPAGGVKSRTQTNESASSNENTQSKDSVSLSNAGKSLAQLEAGLASAPDVDMNKVERVRAELNNGSYSPDDKAIARALLSQDELL